MIQKIRHKPQATWQTASIILAGLFLILSGCDSPFDNKVCTDQFEIIGMSVKTADGTPVVLDEFSVKSTRTGKTIDLCESDTSFCGPSGIHGNPEFGFYSIYHDGLRSEIIEPALGVLAVGGKGDQTFQRMFAIGDDGCHVYLAGGEPELIWESE